MKTKSILLLMLLSALSASAQLRWGVEAGVNISHALETSKTKAGFNVGATAEYSFTNHWFMEMAVKLSSQPCGDKYENRFTNISDENTAYGYSSDYTPYYLAIPIRAGYKFTLRPGAVLSLSAGPMIGIGLFGKGNIDVNDSTSATKLLKTNGIFNTANEAYFSSSRFEYGADIRLGLELKNHYTLGLNYNILHIAGNKTAVDNMNIFAINIGYKF